MPFGLAAAQKTQFFVNMLHALYTCRYPPTATKKINQFRGVGRGVASCSVCHMSPRVGRKKMKPSAGKMNLGILVLSARGYMTERPDAHNEVKTETLFAKII